MDTIGIIFALLASITWGMVYTLDQKILTDISPLTWLVISSFVMFFLTLPIIFWLLPDVKMVLNSGRSNLLIILSSQILIFFATLFIFYAIKHLGSATANIFEISYPVFVVLFSLMIFGGRLTLPFYVGSALIFLGSAIIIKFS